MNIAFAIESFWDGGAEIFAIRLANEFAVKKEYNIFFIELYPEKTSKKSQIKSISENIKIFQPALPADKAVKKIFGQKFRDKIKKQIIKNWILKNKIQIIHSHSWHSDFYFASINPKVKVISTMHGHYEFLSSRVKEFEKTTSKFINKIDYYTYLSNSHLNTLKNFSFNINNTKKIFHGFSKEPVQNPLNFNKLDNELKLIITSRAVKEKGWEEVIQAVIALNKKFDNKITLTLVGDGPFLSELKNIYSQHPFIKFIGYTDNVFNYLQDQHIGLLTSYYSAESMPNSVIEYLCMGLPTIVSDIGSLKEMITTPKNELAGLVIPLSKGKIEIKDIENRIQQFIQDKTIINSKSKLALNAFEKFKMENCILNYENLYKALLNA